MEENNLVYVCNEIPGEVQSSVIYTVKKKTMQWLDAV